MEGHKHTAFHVQDNHTHRTKCMQCQSRVRPPKCHVCLSQVSMLTQPHFERILAMWKYAEQLPCLVLLGDFWQLPAVDATAARCDESAAWLPHVKVLHFHEQVRCKDPNLQKKLNILRTAQPSMKHSLRYLGIVPQASRQHGAHMQSRSLCEGQ